MGLFFCDTTNYLNHNFSVSNYKIYSKRVHYQWISRYLVLLSRTHRLHFKQVETLQITVNNTLRWFLCFGMTKIDTLESVAKAVSPLFLEGVQCVPAIRFSVCGYFWVQSAISVLFVKHGISQNVRIESRTWTTIFRNVWTHSLLAVKNGSILICFCRILNDKISGLG